MTNQVRKLLFDVLESGRSIHGWCQHRTFAEYDAMVWGIIDRYLPELIAQAERLLQGPDTG